MGLLSIVKGVAGGIAKAAAGSLKTAQQAFGDLVDKTLSKNKPVCSATEPCPLEDFARKLNETDLPGKEFPLDAPLKNDESHRSPKNYDAVIDQFQVETSKRYAEPSTQTWCNVFARDVMWNMGAELPAKMDVDSMFAWLQPNITLDAAATKDGWHLIKGDPNVAQTDADAQAKTRQAEARAKANAGYPTIAIMPSHDVVGRDGKVTNIRGHVAAVRPGISKQGYPLVAQAGGTNESSLGLNYAFQLKRDRDQIQYWYHD